MERRNGNGYLHVSPRLRILKEQEFYRESRLPLPAPTVQRWARAKALAFGVWCAGAGIGLAWTVAQEAVRPAIAYAGGLALGSLFWALDRVGRHV